ncbi:hypothetical protein SB6412_02636 [Klebsiella pasteurii]|uniref:S1 family peptidase n=1 Tax=Klebsiella pasteurii TaxID=2587529 RepID=UPI001156EB9B|nr:serine protease [Klebsiella pasteurii]VUS54388.1 hypothetical protein SB6412_02636 [Klebsiella pasteurii]
MYEQWKKAVVHLECATDSEYVIDRIKKQNDLFGQLSRGEISYEQYNEAQPKIRDLRYLGTAIFLSHNENYYLLTARHVLYDEHTAMREYEEQVKRYEGWPEGFASFSLGGDQKQDLNKIFNAIFRVPSLDEALAGRENEYGDSLINLGAGSSFSHLYTFSTPDLDLAIISLNRRNKDFAERLMSLGYAPIPSDLIKDSPSLEGGDVFTVGYPGATSLLGQVIQHPSLAANSSSNMSLPVFSWGKVSMLHSNLPFYWCDMSIYPGNSGGPVIENGELVGIVSAQAVLPVDEIPQIRTRIPFAKIIKTGFVKQLLEEQEAKDLY